MRFRLSAFAVYLLILTACGAGGADDAVRETARQIMAADGFGSANITNVVEGDPATHGADELYCVATDATTQDGALPYLLVVWRIGDTWEGAQLLEGYYEWDLEGCPR